MRLLLVEDEEELVSALAKGLRREGYAVDVALDGPEHPLYIETIVGVGYRLLEHPKGRNRRLYESREAVFAA